MFTILVTVKVKPDSLEDFLQEVHVYAGQSEDEPGCVRFDVLQDAEFPDKIYLYQVFRDDQALDEHRNAPHNLAWAEKSEPWRDHSGYERKICNFVYTRAG